MRSSMTAALVLSVCLFAGVATTQGSQHSTTPNKRSTTLRAFESCGELRAYVRRHRETIRSFWGDVFSLDMSQGGRAPAPAVPGFPSASSSEPTFSGTNVQEAGVDEPDLMKSDGETIFALARERLHAIDVRSADPRWLDSLSIPRSFPNGDEITPQEMLLDGDQILVVASKWSVRGERTLLLQVDASDPSALTVLRTWHAEGSYVSARLNGTSARVVVSSHLGAPGRPPRAPAAGTDAAGPAWLPDAVSKDRVTGQTTRSALVRCTEVSRPADFSGLQLLSVVTADLESGLPPTDVDGVVTDGEIVYGSANSLYVATERWEPPLLRPSRRFRVHTAIHKFDAAVPGQTMYVATGKVPGFMLSQWSLSEHEGVLRVASTSSRGFFPPRSRGSESYVTTLRQSGDRLRRIGQIGGLGRGEQIYAVRFIDDVGYVVTFRQVDPLYTLDLSDPRQPAMAGELKIPGYSAYLHPLGEDRLLGIGQSVARGGVLRGTQISVFDISNISQPVRVERARVAHGTSPVEYDHRAFLHWAPEELMVLPIQIYARRSGQLRYTSARGFRIDAMNGIQHVASIRHGARDMAPISRAAVVADTLFTLSEHGLQANDLGTFAEEAWIPFKRKRSR